MIYLILLWSLYYVIHSLLASEFVKDWFSQRLGKSFRFYRFGFNLISIGGFAAIWLFQNEMVKNRLFEASAAIFLIGEILIGLGVLLGIVAFFQYRWKEFVGIDQIRESQNPSSSKLIIGGFNNHVRHPLYFAGILILIGYLMINPTFQSVIFVSVSLIYLVVGTKLEEKKLVEQFGEEYKAYQKRVKMLIPYLI